MARKFERVWNWMCMKNKEEVLSSVDWVCLCEIPYPIYCHTMLFTRRMYVEWKYGVANGKYWVLSIFQSEQCHFVHTTSKSVFCFSRISAILVQKFTVLFRYILRIRSIDIHFQQCGIVSSLFAVCLLLLIFFWFFRFFGSCHEWNKMEW